MRYYPEASRRSISSLSHRFSRKTGASRIEHPLNFGDMLFAHDALNPRLLAAFRAVFGLSRSMRPAEIGLCRFLTQIDDALPDRACPGEEPVEGVAIAPSDRALKGCQVLVETGEHFQDRVLVR